jgi:hypothetical protein
VITGKNPSQALKMRVANKTRTSIIVGTTATKRIKENEDGAINDSP